MESARIARCTYRSLTVVIALSENSKYLDICNEICLRFKELKVGSFDLTYSLPDHPNCLLQSDMDLPTVSTHNADDVKKATDFPPCNRPKDSLETAADPAIPPGSQAPSK
ncbi:hypothetical protein ACE6H2_019987 [Prunus campanulata]